MKKIAIIGGGIVGSVCAFYLVKAGYDVTLFDDGTGQATKAAVGIICPWVSQRRNKDWYQLVEDGAKFYHQLINDVEDSSFYETSGALLSHDRRLPAMYELAMSRRQSAEIMGEVKIVEAKNLLPEGSLASSALYIEGAARVDGALAISVIRNKAKELGLNIVERKVQFTQLYSIEGEHYDQVVLAAGAWLKELLPNHVVDIRPQKGELIEFTQILKPHNYPLYIPKGEIDLLYKTDGSVVVGASHEDDAGFDLKENPEVLKHLHTLGSTHLPLLSNHRYDKVRVGTRAYTSDFLPFYGGVNGLVGCYVASGLGSSGLTSGPIIGYRLANMIMGSYEVLSTEAYITPHA